MISIRCFKGLPLQYESFLLEKYDSFITSCKYIGIYYPTHFYHYMLVYKNNNLSELLIFGNKGITATCFNGLTKIDQCIMEECATVLFDIYPEIKKIAIEVSYNKYNLRKSILHFTSDNHLLRLPATVENYCMELGSKTRKHIRARNVKLAKEFRNVKFEVKYGAEIEQQLVDKIIYLNCDRMRHKGKTPGIDNNFKNNIYHYSKHYGCVLYLELDGVLVAGCIATIINKEVFLHVIAHDNDYSQFNVGEVCVFHLIQIAIEKNLSTMHFLWGKSELKRRFLAKSHPLYSFYVFKAYALCYLINAINVIILKIIRGYSSSNISKPIRNTVKYMRKKAAKRWERLDEWANPQVEVPLQTSQVNKN